MSSRLVQWVKGFYNPGWKILDTSSGTQFEIDGVTVNLAQADYVQALISVGIDTDDLVEGAGALTIPYWPVGISFNSTPIPTVVTAPVGSDVEFDILVNGASIFSALPTIEDGETDTTSSATPGTLLTATIAKGATVRFDVGAPGSSTAGAGLKWVFDMVKT